MNISNILTECNFLYCFKEWFPHISSCLALILGFGYCFRPRISCCIFYDDNKIKVKLFNNNLSKRLLTNIKCEMTLSNDFTFSNIVHTLVLYKDSIICLKKGANYSCRPNYVFKTLDDIALNSYTHLRVRFLIPNFIGVQKAYEIIVPLNTIFNQCIKVIPKNPKNNSNMF